MVRRIRIEGLVARNGVAFAQGRQPDGRWETPSLVVILRPWRESGGEIRTDELGVRKPTRLPYEIWRLLMPAGRAVALTVDLDESDGRARLVRYRGWRGAKALREKRRDWLEQRQLTDPRFGEFRFDERIDTFEGRATWRGREVTLSVPFATSSKAQGEGLAIAYRLFDAEGEWDRRIREAIVAELLSVFNENWCDEGEAPLGPEDFLSRMTLLTISVDGPELANFYFDDGDLFAGHTINVKLWLEEDEIDADLAG